MAANGSPYWFRPPNWASCQEPSPGPNARSRCSSENETILAMQPAAAFMATQFAPAAPPDTGAGSTAVTHSPSSATTSTGRISPWFQGTREPNRHSISVATAPTVPARVAMP